MVNSESARGSPDGRAAGAICPCQLPYLPKMGANRGNAPPCECGFFRWTELSEWLAVHVSFTSADTAWQRWKMPSRPSSVVDRAEHERSASKHGAGRPPVTAQRIAAT